MTQLFRIHPSHPQARLVGRAVAMLEDGAVIAYPTDSSYALGCRMGEVAAIERIRRIRRLDENHNFTLVCRDLSELSTYAKVDNATYRLLRAHTPGPYTFLLRATREVPRRLQHPKRSTIGLRVPDTPVVRALIEGLGEPLMSVTLILPGDEMPLNDAEDIRERLGSQLDLVIDGGPCPWDPTSVVDLSRAEPRVLRRGGGDVGAFELVGEA